MNATHPMLLAAIYACVLCSLYLQFRGLMALRVALDRAAPKEDPAQRRTRVAGAIGYLCLSAFFGIIGFAKLIQVSA